MPYGSRGSDTRYDALFLPLQVIFSGQPMKIGEYQAFRGLTFGKRNSQPHKISDWRPFYMLYKVLADSNRKENVFPLASTTIHLLAKRKISLVHIAYLKQTLKLNCLLKLKNRKKSQFFNWFHHYSSHICTSFEKMSYLCTIIKI